MDAFSGVIFFFLFVLNFSAADVKYPVILVPGDGGSQLEAKLDKPSVVHYVCDKTTKDYFSLWLNLELFVPVVIDCLIDNMRLVYNNQTHTTSNAPGVDIRVVGFGNCSSVEWIDPSKASAGSYYAAIATMLFNLGYEGNRTLRGAPYDFRKGPNEHSEYFKNLKLLVEDTYAVNGNKPVVLLVHSLGALMTLTMLNQQTQSWKDKHIRAMISLAGAWGGSAKAVKVYAIGDDLGVFVLSGKTLRTEQISNPSLAFLMPSPHLWKSDEVLVETDTKNYSLSNIKEFFDDINYSVAWDMYQDVSPFVKNLKPPGVELFCIYGYGTPTVEKLLYLKDKFPTKDPLLVMGDGDGTVNRRSLQSCTAWSSQQKKPIHEMPISKVNHMSILYSVSTLEYVKQIIEAL